MVNGVIDKADKLWIDKNFYVGRTYGTTEIVYCIVFFNGMNSVVTMSVAPTALGILVYSFPKTNVMNSVATMSVRGAQSYRWHFT
jgi:hypothetical protein